MTTKHYHKQGYAAGVKLACAARGITENEAVRTSSKVDTLLANTNIQNMICKAAAIVLQLGGEEGSVEHRLFTKMAAYAYPFHSHTVETFIVPVLKSFAQYGRDMRDAGMAKQASISELAGSLAGAVAKIPKGLLTLAGLGGVGIGGLGWLLNRNANETEVETEALEEQAAHYRRIAKDIQKRMRLDDVKNIREAAEDAGEANYVL